jgi:FAD synthase
VHIFGVDEVLYGQMVKVAWVVKLRDIRAYPDVSALKAQIEKDARAARDALTRGWWRAST